MSSGERDYQGLELYVKMALAVGVSHDDTRGSDRLYNSGDLIAMGMAADEVRRKLHPDNVVSYIIDRNINYTNFCTEYCSFCAFYRPMGHAEGYVHPKEVIFQKIQETIDLGGTGILMQGGLHPELRSNGMRICCARSSSASTSGATAFRRRRSSTSPRSAACPCMTRCARLRDAGLDSLPGGGAEILDDEVRHRISRIKSSVQDWIGRSSRLRTGWAALHRDHDVRNRRNHRAAHESLRHRAQLARGDRRQFHGVHPVELPAREHLARALREGRGDGRGIFEDAGAVARLSG